MATKTGLPPVFFLAEITYIYFYRRSAFHNNPSASPQGVLKCGEAANG